jgi:uncharacterized protein
MTHDLPHRFRPAWWLRNPHAQTMWGKFGRPAPKVRTAGERLESPDGDAIDLHHLQGSDDAPRMLILHGLEGSVRSHYVGGILAQAHARGWGATVLVFRGCGSSPNTARRFYHSGETTDLAFVYRTLSARWPRARWLFIGVSLGGNVLLKWLGERPAEAGDRTRAAVAVSVPFDLEAGARHIRRGFARVYDRSFLKSLRRKALAKLRHYPDLFDRSALERARSVFEFDDAVTAPVHGFTDARHYYQQSSALAFLDRIRVRTLLLSSEDDPFLPPSALKRVAEVARRNPRLQVEFHAHGGHVGFVSGALPWRPFYYAEWRAFQFFEDVMEADRRTGYD